MPRNGTGTYNLPTGNPVTSGTLISSSWANSTMPDLGNEITNSLPRDGQAPMTGTLKLPDGVATGPAITFSGETNSGMYRDSTGTVAISASSAPVAKFKSDASTTFFGNISTNGTGTFNIGSATNKFNVVYGTAVTAQYADLAELYVADADYAAGTVVEFGGEHEVTESRTELSRRVAGVVSTRPAYLMNSDCKGDHVVAVALVGRVPCYVVGVVRKGDLLVSAGCG